MGVWGKIKQYLTDRDFRRYMFDKRGIRRLDDKTYIEILFRRRMGYSLDWDNLRTLNEKLQWLKLYNRNPLYTVLVDKYEVKRYIDEHFGDVVKTVPTLGVWDNPDDIDFDALPAQFVLKCTHNSAEGLCICKDKSQLDIPAVKAALKRGLARDFYLDGREWPYKNVPRRVLAEPYMSDSADAPDTLTDYKFTCYDGHVDSVMVCLDRASGDTKFYHFDRDWQLRRYNPLCKAAPEGFTVPKPANIDEMFDVAARLSEGLPFARVDLYNIDGDVYFSEITFFPCSGFDDKRLPETDAYFGEKLTLPEKWNTEF